MKEQVQIEMKEIFNQICSKLKDIKSDEEREYILFSIIGNYNEKFHDELFEKYQELDEDEGSKFLDNIINNGIEIPIPEYDNLLQRVIKDTKILADEMDLYIQGITKTKALMEHLK